MGNFIRFLDFIMMMVIVIQALDGARILGIIPLPSYSHQVVYYPLWKELSKRGHQDLPGVFDNIISAIQCSGSFAISYHKTTHLFVTVVTAKPMNDPSLTNLTEIDISDAFDLWKTLFANMDNFKLSCALDNYQKTMITISDFVLSRREVQNLIKNESLFDVVMVEAIFPEFFAFGELYKCPIIQVFSMDASTLMHYRMGNSMHPIIKPETYLPYHKPHNFRERLLCTIGTLFLLYKRAAYSKERTKVIRKYFGSNASDDVTLAYKVDMLFTNVHPAFEGARLQGPSTVMFNGLNLESKPKPLPPDVKTFLDESSEGVVYFSLGSQIKSSDLEQNKLDNIINALSQLPYKVLWKFEKRDLPGKPSNVKIIEWAPQRDVLRHPNVRAFVMQGGLQSLEESIYENVPVVVLPFNSDQPKNAARVRDLKIGISIFHLYTGLRSEELKDAIIEVIKNPNYRTNIKELADVMYDEPMTGLQKLVWWTEYVIRHKGAKYLRNITMDVPLYQYLFLDVIGFLAGTLIVVLCILSILWNKLKSFFSYKLKLFAARVKEKKYS